MEAKNLAESANPADHVVLIVRPQHNYGGVPAGSLVIVDRKELRVPSTRAACLTLEEHEEAEAERKRREEEALKKKTASRSLVGMVTAQLGSLADRAVEKAKELAAEQQAEAERLAAAQAHAAAVVPDAFEDAPKKSKKGKA